MSADAPSGITPTRATAADAARDAPPRAAVAPDGPIRPRFKESTGKKGRPELSHARVETQEDYDAWRAALNALVNSDDNDLAARRMQQLPAPSDVGTALALNTAVAALEAIGPRDHVELMFATQMLHAHDLAVRCFAAANRDGISYHVAEIETRRAARCIAAFAASALALQRYRTPPSPAVSVGDVTVNAGGQAIVGRVTAPGRLPVAAETPRAANASWPSTS